MVHIAYTHVNRNSNTLLIYFNDMTKVGPAPIFSSFKTLTNIFTCDIIFIKDIDILLWYLTIHPECTQIINDLIEQYKFQRVFGLSTSSGTIPLLNIMPTIKNFKHGFIINGQSSLEPHIVDKYKHCNDCAIFNPAIISDLNQNLIAPLTHTSDNMLLKYTFYCNNSVSDKVYYNYLCNIGASTNIQYEPDGLSHYDYIIKKMTSIDLPLKLMLILQKHI